MKTESNFKILIVDDEVLIAEYLKDLLLALDFKMLELAHNKKQTLEAIETFKPNLILLDIRMRDELQGIHIAEIVNEEYNIPFIFITAQSDKEIIQKALLTKPVGYITKPFKQPDVYAAVKLVQEKYSAIQEQFLIFKDGYNTVKLSVDDILFVHANDNYIDIYCTTKKYTLRNKLEWFIENVPTKMFHRLHRSYIVNITKVTKATTKSVFINEKEIPVARGHQVRF